MLHGRQVELGRSKAETDGLQVRSTFLYIGRASSCCADMDITLGRFCVCCIGRDQAELTKAKAAAESLKVRDGIGQ